jgi:hypothetical protein
MNEPHMGGGSAPGTSGRPETEEELRAAYEAELKRITVADVLVQTTVSLVNLAGRKIGLSEGTTDERDLDQVREAVDAVRALLPLVERHGDVKPIRDALSQLQLAYAREVSGGGAAHPGAEGERKPGAEGTREGEATPADEATPGGETTPGGERKPGDKQQREPGPAQSSGRLWVPDR